MHLRNRQSVLLLAQRSSGGPHVAQQLLHQRVGQRVPRLGCRAVCLRSPPRSEPRLPTSPDGCSAMPFGRFTTELHWQVHEEALPQAVPAICCHLWRRTTSGAS